ncbi:helix-turn-helix transcriptional regulator [Mycobacterium sp. BK086]|uniref:helix-turn-helix domain-containing protein n=1 Tax=Mycobacterium sp. BK086 TaxID=2512165 RepID=UPI0014150139|nr:helix-turn-helix transcriptional regulator [Mycobacterium sp. BK086]
MAAKSSSHQTTAARTSSDASLGAYLRQIRGLLNMTLRDVEAATDKSVSNGYLSQIESGSVEKPSPSVLYHLANVYDIDYADLMTRAGHRIPKSASEVTVAPQTVAGVPLRALQELDEQDQELLRDYLEFLKSRKKNRS